MKHWARNLLGIVVCAAMVIGLVPGVLPAAGAEVLLSGSGTSADPYQISNANQLIEFAKIVNGTSTTTTQNKSACAKLMADIPLSSGTNWMPIGNATNQYSGTFEGNGRTISGLSVDLESMFAGLFGYCAGATIQNLTVQGEIKSNKSIVGGIAGFFSGGKINNCSFSGIVSGSDNIVSGSENVGGIAGFFSGGKITNCSFSGIVSGSYYTGGIIGCADNNAKTEQCSFSGTVSGNGSHHGGIVGVNQSGSVIGCVNSEGKVSGGNYIGGITGSSVGTISRCTNSAEVAGSYQIGGICGGFQSESTIISDCTNLGEVSGNYQIGGIAGISFSGISGCTNTGTITFTDGPGYVGGIVGKNDGTLSDCIHTGTVMGSGNKVYEFTGSNNLSVSSAGNGNVGVSISSVNNDKVTVTLIPHPVEGYTLLGFTVNKGVVEIDEKNSFALAASNTDPVRISATFGISATCPTFSTQPNNLIMGVGYGEGYALTAEAADIDGHAITYQWYSNSTQTNTGGEPIDGATNKTFAIPTGKALNTEEFYYCVATATRNDNGAKASTASDAVSVKVTEREVFTVTFAVVGGTWNDKDSGDKKVELSRGKGEDLALVLKPEQIPTPGEPKAGFKSTGSWDEDPNNYSTSTGKLTITEDKTFTYSFVAKTAITPVVTMSGYVYGSPATPAISGNPGNGAVTYYYGTEDKSSDGTEWNPITPPQLNAGKYYLYATVAETDEYAPAVTAPVAFTVSKRDVSLTSESGEKIYDGTALTKPDVTVGGSGFVTGEVSDLKATGSVTTVAEGVVDNTITWTPGTAFKADNYAITKTEGKLKINPKSITGAEVFLDKTQLTYNGSEQTVNVTGVTIDGLSLSGKDYEVTGNKGTNKGTYTITVKGIGNFKDSVTAEWSIVEKAMTVTATGYSGYYDGTAHGITVSVEDPAKGTTVKYGKNAGTYDLDESPMLTDIGTMTVYFKVTAENYIDYVGSAPVMITKKPDAVVVTAPAAKDMTFTGSAQELVTAGTAEGGTIQYALGADAVTVPDTSWSVSVPSAAKVGTWYVWYKVVGDANHSDIAPVCVTTEIKNADMTVTATGYTGIYDGKAHGITVDVTVPADGAVVKYGTAEGTYDLDASPTITDAAASPLKVFYQVTADGYNPKTSYETVTITKAAAKVTKAPTAVEDLIEDGKAHELVKAGTAEGGTLQYALKDNGTTAPESGWSAAIPTADDAGTYYVWYKAVGDANHSDSAAVCVTAEIKQKEETGIPAIVSGCYRYILGREPDEAGKAYWIEKLESGEMTACGLMVGFFESDECKAKGNMTDEAFIVALYRTMMNREPDPAGKAYWMAKLGAGSKRQEIIDEFCRSVEFSRISTQTGIKPDSGRENPAEPVKPAADMRKIRAFVARCYQSFLGREPDVDGLYYWADRLGYGGLTAVKAIEAFVTGDEFLSRKLSTEDTVEALYRVMLNRAADPEGKAHWVTVLDAGNPIAVVINGIASSPEFKGICEEYGMVAGRLEVAELPAGMIPEGEITVEVPAAEEVPEDVAAPAPADRRTEQARAFVVHCYKSALNRDPGAEEADYYVNQILTGQMTAKDMARAFAFSQEFQGKWNDSTAFVRVLYRLCLDREADADGLVFWTDKLAGGESTATVFNALTETSEFVQVCAKYGVPAGVNANPIRAQEEAVAAETETAEPASEFKNQEKIRAFVSRFYRDAMGREADEEGLNFFTGKILNGETTPKDVAKSIILSDEFRGKMPGNEELVKILYRVYLGREADEEGLANWVGELDNGTSLETVLNGFAGSEEFVAVVNGLK